MVTFEQIKESNEITIYIKKGNDLLGAIGYTEHGFAHAGKVSEKAENILRLMGYPDRMVELGKIAAYMHDIGNCVNRNDHAQSGAIMAFQILNKINFSAEKISADIHDRVNYAVEHSEIVIFPELKKAVLSLQIDTSISPVMEYFEIFLSRMVLCRNAAEYLGLTFELNVNNIKLL